LGDPQHECTCSVGEVQRYRARISGPLLDRIDLHVEVPGVRYKELSDSRRGESSELVRTRVEKARQRQLARFNGDATGVLCNALMLPKHLREHCRVDREGERLLEMVVDRLGMSARAYNRILKVARTIADLEGAPDIKAVHLSEAIQYRTLDRRVA
jgi:magnesium chelatase family protein